MHSNGEKVHLRDKNFDSGRMHTWIIFRNRVVSSCLISFSAFKAGPIPHELQVRYQTCRDTLWSMWSILTVSIFFPEKFDLIKLMYSCGIQFGLADKSLQMHPLFSQWHMKKDLNTEHNVRKSSGLLVVIPFKNCCPPIVGTRIVRFRQRCARRPCDAGKTWDGPQLWSVKAGKN